MALPPTAVEALDSLREQVKDLVGNALGYVPDGLSDEEREEFIREQERVLDNALNAIRTTQQTQGDIGDAMSDGSQEIPNTMQQASAYFDLKKEAQYLQDTERMNEYQAPLDAPLDDSYGDEFQEQPYDEGQFEDDLGYEDEEGEEETLPSFESHAELHEWIQMKMAEGEDSTAVRQQLMSMVGDEEIYDEETGRLIDPASVIAENVEEYFLTEGEEERLNIAEEIFRVMPQDNSERKTISVVDQTVAETNGAIRKLAIEYANYRRKKEAQTKNKPYNLSKTAQHKGLENVIIHGPSGNRIDPFTGQLISDWHIYERNKGFGINPGDAPFVDYEAIWRGYVMDKYSRPYKDEEGNWVGGYLKKRFDIDEFIPEGNSYQLKPGQKRRPYIPEFRSTESRLQSMRAKPDGRGRVFNDTSKPFNWKQAKTKKKTDINKQAYLDGEPGRPKNDPFVFPEIGETQGEAQKRNTPAQQKTCPVCKATCAPTESKCHVCSADLTGSAYIIPHAVPQAKQSNHNKQAYQKYPTNHLPDVWNAPTTETFERRKKRFDDNMTRESSDDFVDINSTNPEHENEVHRTALMLGLEDE